MVLWFIVGFIVWALCISLMLVVFRGGHRVRGHGYEQKLHLRSMENARKARNPIRGVTKGTAPALYS